ncbi:hypothetical protein FNW02_01350 [Komarekiella sp. 'clone 1']|uniref:Ribbon-helix-helix protein CopG domain-containing protein n=1 Tax=Komarekiella delphini-convector SJRDD-AB1 TaxID=2593771 RepID=A0AA40VPD7_9NOST|nr:hypothetical protein [Komarekiella delphini-convector]MBD6614550.1 hypothetical protein [Komarekiella delphini-convector SJRDD-AB1]
MISTDKEKSSLQKITVNLPPETIAVLKRLADQQGITATAALRKAIATEDFLRREAVNKEAKVLIQEPNGTTKQVVFI